MNTIQGTEVTRCQAPDCNESFKKSYSRGGTDKKYCSNVCYSSSRSAIESTCQNPTCGASFAHPKSVARKYCSRRCSAENQSTKRPSKGEVDPRNSRRLSSECSRCNSPISTAYRYCSDCSENRPQWVLEDKVTTWLEIGSSAASDTSGELSDWARSYLIARAEDKCTECGWCTPNPILGRPILTVDHIDGNWKNNNFDNLKVLCYNCHTLTDTWGRLNKTSGGTRPRSGTREHPKDSGFVCLDCGVSISRGASRCAEHSVAHRRSKIDWPEITDLVNLVSRIGFDPAGKTLGVSGNAVRKRISREGVDPYSIVRVDID